MSKAKPLEPTAHGQPVRIPAGTVILDGVARVQLEVAAGNTPAIALYERLGCRKVARLAGYYGAGQHAWTMAKALDAAEGRQA